MLTAALMLSACSLPFGQDNSEPAATDAPVPEESAAPQLCDNEPALAAEFGIERLIAQLSDRQIFTDAEGELANKVVFSAKRDIKDFRYLEVSAELSNGGEMIVTEKEPLYTLSSLNAGDVIMISMFLEGYVPDRAISYVDDCGGTHYFHVAVSGEDNVPIIIPCTPSE